MKDRYPNKLSINNFIEFLKYRENMRKLLLTQEIPFAEFYILADINCNSLNIAPINNRFSKPQAHFLKKKLIKLFQLDGRKWVYERNRASYYNEWINRKVIEFNDFTIEFRFIIQEC